MGRIVAKGIVKTSKMERSSPGTMEERKGKYVRGRGIVDLGEMMTCPWDRGMMAWLDLGS